MNRKSGGWGWRWLYKDRGAGSRIWKVMEEEQAALLSRFAHTPPLCTVLGGSRSFRQFASLQGRHWATVGDPPYKGCLSLLPGNLLPEVAKSLPVSASVGCVGRQEKGRKSSCGGQMEYVVGVGREVCVGFNSGRFCRI